MITPAAAPAMAAPASAREAGASRAEGFDEAMASALGLVAPATNPSPVTPDSSAGQHSGAVPVVPRNVAVSAVGPTADSPEGAGRVMAATDSEDAPSPANGTDTAPSAAHQPLADPGAPTSTPVGSASTPHNGVATAEVPRHQAPSSHLPSEDTASLLTSNSQVSNASVLTAPADQMATANLSLRQNAVEPNEAPSELEPRSTPIPDDPIPATQSRAGHQIAPPSSPPAEHSEDPAAPETATSPVYPGAPPPRRVGAHEWFLQTPSRDSTTDGALEPVGQRPPDLQPIADGAETSPRVATALLQRVEEVVRRLENAPPPRSITVTIDDQGLTRITVSLMADGVRLTVPEGSNTPATLVTDLEQALSNRGFDMSRDRDRKPHEDQLADANPHPAPNQPPPAARLSTDSGVRL